MAKENDVGKIASVTMRVRVGDAEIEVTGPPDFVKTEIRDFLERAPSKSASAFGHSVFTPLLTKS